MESCKYCSKKFKYNKSLIKHQVVCKKNPKNKKVKVKVKKVKTTFTSKKRLFTKKDITELIYKSSGTIFSITKMCNITYQTIKDFLNKHPDLYELLLEQKPILKEIATYNIAESIKDGNIRDSKWFLTYIQTEELKEKELKIEEQAIINVVSNSKKEIDKL